MSTKALFGKYRATVINNVDPLQIGRIQAIVPDVLGIIPSTFALPCLPAAGKQSGAFFVPEIGAGVWIEFEQGDPDYPIWSGCFWGVGEVPAQPAVAQMKVLKTDGINLQISDLPGAGGFTLEVGPPAVPVPLKIVLDASGIELSHGAASVKLTPASVSVNNGALEVI